MLKLVEQRIIQYVMEGSDVQHLRQDVFNIKGALKLKEPAAHAESIVKVCQPNLKGEMLHIMPSYSGTGEEAVEEYTSNASPINTRVILSSICTPSLEARQRPMDIASPSGKIL